MSVMKRGTMFTRLQKNNQLHTESNSIEEVIGICEGYRESLVVYCQSYFEFDYDTAADCVQEAYVALSKSLLNGTKINNYKAWLYKVVTNYGNKEIKKRIKRNEYEFIDSEEKEKAIENALSFTPDYVENMISDAKIKKAWLHIVDSLNKDEKTLYFDYYCEHKKLEEIALKLGISIDAVKKRNERLKKKLEDKARKYKDY